MHNGMYPGFAKLQTRPTSPQFSNFSPRHEFGQVEVHAASQNANFKVESGHGPVIHHEHSMSMRPSRSMTNKQRPSASHINTNSVGIRSGNGSLGHHRGDLIFTDDIDSLEMCVTLPPPNCFESGVNSEMLLEPGNGEEPWGEETFLERRRRIHSHRSNHKMDADHQVKWSRKNIAATMERFEPTDTARCSSSSTSSLEYGFTASIIASGLPLANPSQMSSAAQLLPSGTDINGALGPHNHVYSYAYYEPGAAKCHTNVPYKDGAACNGTPTSQQAQTSMGSFKSAPRNSLRSLLAKSFRSKSNSGHSPSASAIVEDRHTYTTRYGTTENLYEEVNEQKIRKVLSDNRIAMSAANNVKEELRRVQHNHFRVLDELNLSLEALIMPPSPLDASPKSIDESDETIGAMATSGMVVPSIASTSNASTAATSQRPRRCGLLGGDSSSLSTSSQPGTLSQASLDNISTTLNLMELKEHSHNSCVNTEFDEGDLDSGFSGSGSSSGASYNESLRCYKTGSVSAESRGQIPLSTISSSRSPTVSGTSTSKSSMASQEDQGISMGLNTNSGGAPLMSADRNVGNLFDFARRCSDVRSASMRSASASASASSSSSATTTGAKPKRSFWTIKP